MFGKQSAINKMLELSAQCRYAELVRSYPELSQKDKAKPEILYLLAYALMQIRKTDEAKKYLQAALKKGFNGYPRWTSARSMLRKIGTIEKFRPPLLQNFCDQSNQQKLRIYASHTEWINYVISAVPFYVQRVETVFGKEIPPVDFYLFAARDEYNDFFKAMFDGHQPSLHQDGTGDKNMVLFCQIAASGKIEIPAGSNRALGNVLHEYSHSICHSIYGDNYLADVPEWLDEGIADYVAEPYYAEQYKSYDERLINFAKTHGAPSYKQMCKELHKDANIRYALACMMVKELLSDRGEDLIKKLMNSAVRLHDFNKAIVEVAGYRPELLLKRVVRKYWNQPAL